MWIEIISRIFFVSSFFVTPFAGVWIEIVKRGNKQMKERSLPLRECGLKYIRRQGRIVE